LRPYADTEATQLHLDEISRIVARGARAVLLLGRASRHTTSNLAVPNNLTLLFPPSRAPELNPVENVWQDLRANWLSNRVFETCEAVVEAAREAWRKLLAQPHTITPIGGKRAMNITYVHPLKHVEGTLMVYLPAEKLVVEADLFDTHEPPPAEPSDGARILHRMVGTLKYEVDRIVPIHGAPIAWSEFLAKANVRK
jgi:hypothetical protein